VDCKYDRNVMQSGCCFMLGFWVQC